MALAADIIKYSRLALGLRGFLRGTITLEESQRVIAERLRHREKNFLNLVQKGVYQNPKSPFLKLLELAGCEYGDIEPLVNKDGVEAALKKLLAEGVYVSWEEFKGRKEVVRGGKHFQFKQTDFDNPFLDAYYRVQSSGSRSPGTRTTFELSHQLATTYYRLPMLVVNNAMDVPVGVWKPVLPAVSGTSNLLQMWKVGKPVAKWFSDVDEGQAETPLTHRLAMRYIIYGSRLWGARLVKPEYVGIQKAVDVARWLADTRRRFGGCCLISSVSPAVKMCRVAIEDGLDIDGVHLIVSGEPLTPAKRRQMEAAGVSVSSRYAISEIGRIGCGCLEAGPVDDNHLLHDTMALIQRRRKVAPSDISVDAFLFTPLLTTSPRIVLNMESDDYGVIENRKCDCLLGQMGFNTHIHDIRSFAKLTGSGMTLVGTDLVHILEEILPVRFGGTAADYQLLEEEDEQGQTLLSLIISPEVGEVDEGDVIATLLKELRRVPHPGKLTAGVWAQAEILRVKRMHPVSNMGKVATLQLIKK
jgi:hypothetical protein